MKKLVFCGGGSAGHVMPNIALWQDIKQHYQCFYLGTSGIEKGICENYGIPFYEIDAPKLIRGKIKSNLTIPYRLHKAIKESKIILQQLQPDLIFCKGGFACLPPAVASHKLKIPFLTHESDMTMGLANRLIARYADAVLTSFPQTAKSCKKGVYTGTPLNKRVLGGDRTQARVTFGFDWRPTILIMGGGSGSEVINRAVTPLLPTLCQKYNVLHLVGKGHLTATHYYGYKQMEFCHDMGLVYAISDFAIARCGSNTAFELTTNGIPTLFIPLENMQSRGDQVENARYFEQLGVCHVLKERELNSQTLNSALQKLIQDKQLKNGLAHLTTLIGNEKIENEIARAIKAK